MKKRVFKFRAWDADGVFDAGAGKMIYFDNDMMRRIPGMLEALIRLNNNENGKDVVMQWTGFNDSEGNDIYEGDVVEDVRERRAVILWGDAVGSWLISQPIGSSLAYKQDRHTVIGNIYENPRLLEGK